LVGPVVPAVMGYSYCLWSEYVYNGSGEALWDYLAGPLYQTVCEGVIILFVERISTGVQSSMSSANDVNAWGQLSHSHIC
jgi:hypothetical protein